MAVHGSPDAPKAFDFSTFSPFVAAIVAAGGAFALFEPKLERMHAIKNETGRFEAGFVAFYVLPQWLLIFVSVAIVVFLGLACVDVIQPSLLSGIPQVVYLRAAFEIHYVAWTIVSAAILAVIIRWNWIPRALLLLARALSVLPISGLCNRFGPQGESVGWHQAKAVCEGPDKGAPLLINEEDLDRVARVILTRLSHRDDGDGDDENFAATPANLSEAEKANIALFGCVMEANVSANRWKRPKWREFYASFADIQRSTPMFAPAQIQAFESGNAFFEEFRGRLDTALAARNQPRPTDRSLEAAGDIARAWELLTRKAEGNTLLLVPPIAGLLVGKVAWIDRRLRVFPRMNSDGMRPQLIKLLTRWGCLPMSDGVFVQPFSKTIAWLLLQEGALGALPETKEVTFNSFGQAPISRLAMKRVLQRVARLIDEGASAEARKVAETVGSSEWRRFEAGDFILWSWSNAERKAAAGTEESGASTPWDKSKWKWKFEEDRILRQS
jgi:hypothetical protein